MRLWRPRHGIHSLRGKLTLANVGLLALGIVVATAVSLMGMRHYLLDQVDAELVKTRSSLGSSRLTLRQIDSLAALSIVRDRLLSPTDGSPEPDMIFALADRSGEAVSMGGFAPDRKSVV